MLSNRSAVGKPRRTAGAGALGQKPLEHPTPIPNNPPLLANLDPDLHGPPLGIPAGVLGNDGWEWTPLALSCSKVQSDKNTRRREGQVGMTAGTALNHSADEVIE
jgi:hypothetical protein